MTIKKPCMCSWGDVMGVLDEGEHFPSCPHATRETVPEGYMRDVWDREHPTEAPTE